MTNLDTPNPAVVTTDLDAAVAIEPDNDAVATGHNDGVVTERAARGEEPFFSPPRAIVWPHISADDAPAAWRELDAWVEDIRHRLHIPAQVIPPFWHRHNPLVEHLCAAYCAYLGATDIEQDAAGPHRWLRELPEWETRMKNIVARLGIRTDSPRTNQIAPWPGETPATPAKPAPPVLLADRYQDFAAYVDWDTRRRQVAAYTEERT